MLQKGFTIFELLLALAIVGILLLMVLPYTKDLLERNRALAYAHELQSALRLARVSAIYYGEPVIFCGSKDHKKCDGLWQEGSLVVTASGKILRVLSKVFTKDKLIWCGGAIAKKQITFFPKEFLYGQQGSFYYCPNNYAENGLSVILWVTGRVRISEIELNNLELDTNPLASCDPAFICQRHGYTLKE